MKHTPTPWEFDADRCKIVSRSSWFLSPEEAAEMDADPIPTSVVDCTGAMGGEDGDIDFICRAVNSHDALVEALSMAAMVMSETSEILKKYEPMKFDFSANRLNACADIARAALALAKEGNNER